LGALADALRPALHDRLLLGVEAHAFLAVGVHVAEQALLPAAEAVPGHRHGDRHVDADHAHLYTPRELACHVAVAREARDAVAELVVIDEVDRSLQVMYAHAGEHRAEDLFLVDLHLGRDMVEPRAAHPEPAPATFTGLSAVEAAAVDEQLGAFLRALR